MIVLTPNSWAVRTTDSPMASVTFEPLYSSKRCRARVLRLCSSSSVRTSMSCIAWTDCTGYKPLADSPDSMVASVPSRTALATSVTSARVGRGCSCIESSICVAVITGLPNELHFLIKVFWTNGTLMNGISTPMSPRATIKPSETCKISSMLSIPSCDSIFGKIFT